MRGATRLGGKLVLLFVFSMILPGCDRLIGTVSWLPLKMKIVDLCGKEDPECVAAVDDQFYPCHKKFEQDWEKYLNSNSSNEDELVNIYLEKIYGCLVDKDGDPYFIFEPEKSS